MLRISESSAACSTWPDFSIWMSFPNFYYSLFACWPQWITCLDSLPLANLVLPYSTLVSRHYWRLCFPIWNCWYHFVIRVLNLIWSYLGSVPFACTCSESWSNSWATDTFEFAFGVPQASLTPESCDHCFLYTFHWCCLSADRAPWFCQTAASFLFCWFSYSSQIYLL